MKNLTIAAAVFAALAFGFLIFAAVSFNGQKAAALRAEQNWKNSAAPLKSYLDVKSQLAALGAGSAPATAPNIPVILNQLNPQAQIERTQMSWKLEGSQVKVTYTRLTLPQFGLLLDRILQNHPYLQVRGIVITASKDSPDGYDIVMNVAQAKS